MLLGLKNTKATCQRLMKKMFNALLEKTMEIYIDDTMVKSKKECDHIQDLDEYFQILKKYKMRLYRTKCAFSVSSRQFLGHVLRGELKPTQCRFNP